MTYNLDENAQEFFEFVIDGHSYQMRYPTTEEMDQFQKIKDEKDVSDRFYSFITSVGEAPPIEETIKKTTIKKSRAFLKMIREEFTGEA